MKAQLYETPMARVTTHIHEDTSGQLQLTGFQSDMPERGMMGSTEYVVCHEKALGYIILYVQEHHRKKAVSRSLAARSKTHMLPSVGTYRCTHVPTLTQWHHMV